MRGEFGVAGDALKRPVGFLFAGNNFHAQPGGGLDGGGEGFGIPGIARGAGGDDAGGLRAEVARGGGKIFHSRGGGGDGGGLEEVIFVEALAEAGLLAVFEQGARFAAGDFGDEEFDGVSADINDGTFLRRRG